MSAEIESLTTDVKSRRAGSGASPMLAALVAVALLLAAYGHWRLGQYDERIDRLRGQIADLRVAQDRLATSTTTLAQSLESSQGTWRSELRGLREVPAQVDELGQSVEELRARTEAPQRAWVRAEALYLLELAERRLKLEGDVYTAIVAMESADARLAMIDDPAMREVRTALGSEIAALRAVPQPDLPSVLARIAALEDAVPALPVIGMPVSQVHRASPEPESKGALVQAWRRLTLAAGDLISLRRIEPGTGRLVTQEEESLRRQHVELLLFAARVAAMQPDGAAYVQSLGAAATWIGQYFDASRPETAAALAEIDELRAIQIDPSLPGIGAAGRLLQGVIRGSPGRP